MLMHGMKSIASDVFVAAKPEFTDSGKTRQQNIMHKIGSTVRLKCTAKGNPPPSIMWLKNGQVLNLDGGDRQNGR